MDWNKVGALGSIGCFVISLLLFAAQVWPMPQLEAKPAHTVAFTTPHAMSFFLIAGFLLAGMSIFGAWRKQKFPTKWTFKQSEETVVYGHTFANEKVEIDGKKFDHCTFRDVTLFYHGVAPVDFVVCNFTGNLTIETDNDAAKAFMRLSQMARNLPHITGVEVMEKDDRGNQIPIRMDITPTRTDNPDGQNRPPRNQAGETQG